MPKVRGVRQGSEVEFWRGTVAAKGGGWDGGGGRKEGGREEWGWEREEEWEGGREGVFPAQ